LRQAQRCLKQKQIILVATAQEYGSPMLWSSTV